MQPLQTPRGSLRVQGMVCMMGRAGLGAKSCQPSVVLTAPAGHRRRPPSPFGGPLLLSPNDVLWPPCPRFQAGLSISLAWPTKHNAMEPPCSPAHRQPSPQIAAVRWRCWEGLQMTLPPKQSCWTCLLFGNAFNTIQLDNYLTTHLCPTQCRWPCPPAIAWGIMKHRWPCKPDSPTAHQQS
ncbi:uncharacterized protein LY79DRAFT_407510 [Colletotrichum navitas]|uniref:Uncharacterized protein n=1 Tax=Colletotrichum navitas TaxID=681940 RepID=A0AAD8Q7C6_9PEZI|nr:uncharacterized protein LY79DRAFT_407510 [Colletotrichum navitas]KAK1597195.1 hypothetical protein LY79DRAFT_407510 [Colletotrichum navitas]